MTNEFLRVVIVLPLMIFIASAQAKQNSPGSLLQDAAQAISAGKLEQAENELRLVLRSAPDEVRALDLLGVIKALQHRASEAEELFVKVVAKNPEFGPGQAHLGLLYMQTGRHEEALPHLREALRIDPARSDAAAGLVHALQNQSQSAVKAGDLGKALTLLKEARTYASDDPDMQFEFGTVALQLSFLQDAIEAFQRTLRLRRDDALARYNLGRAFMAQSQFEDARQQFSEYINMRPSDPSGYCALGMTLAALERSQEARTEFERSIELQPVQTESYYRLALLEFKSRDLENASRHVHQVLDHDPTHTGALTMLGKIAFERKDYFKAISILEQVIVSDDSMREAHYYLGLALARVGRKSESEEQMEIALRLEHEEVEHRRTVLILDPGSPVGQGTSVQK